MTSEQVFASASNGPLTIRPYEAQDQAAVRDLFIRVNRELAPAHLKEPFEAYIALSLREEIDRIPAYYAASRGASFWVAADKNGLVGNFGLEPVDAGLELRRMYVDPRARRQGLGRLMLAHAEFVAREQGHARIVLSTSELQSAAIRLYRVAGYHLIREEVATTATNRTVGSGLRRYYFEKPIVGGPASLPDTPALQTKAMARSSDRMAAEGGRRIDVLAAGYKTRCDGRRQFSGGVGSWRRREVSTLSSGLPAAPVVPS